MNWSRLSVRTGSREPDGPYEGVPGHLRHGLTEWLMSTFGWTSRQGMDKQLMNHVAATLRLEVSQTYVTGGISDQIFAHLDGDEDLFLDCVDLVLNLKPSYASSLKPVLDLAGSVWRVNGDGNGLERRASSEAKDAFDSATSVADAVSAELSEAWSRLYGRQPDPSDAWDHAIKAVEELLAPVIIPANTNATLGTILEAIDAKPSKWTLGLEAGKGKDSMQILADLLRLIWPNPDRHGGNEKRTPRQDEAERVVHVAALVVNLSRDHLAPTAPT